MYYRVSFEAVVLDILPFLLPIFALAAFVSYMAYRKSKKISAFIPTCSQYNNCVCVPVRINGAGTVELFL